MQAEKYISNLEGWEVGLGLITANWFQKRSWLFVIS